MDDTDREFMEGKIQGLERICLLFIRNRGTWWPDVASRIEWEIMFSNELTNLIAKLEDGPTADSPRGQGQLESIRELQSKLISG